MTDKAKKIVIIGATSGIGFELCKLYIQQGVIVGIAGRREEKLKEIQ
ncbi:MAG: SDR family NAD(P)-dependent oxidoreductase, partial [Bacteroidales bacterium]|nr:SDR family NAD(P)-dependent oxidoreductase [Bacteroidales bacterium]